MHLFITVEGGEYVGKTSLVVPALKEIFTRLNWQVLASREPGGTKKAEAIRKQIFKLANKKNNQRQLTELFFKARKIHIDEKLKPFIQKNKNKNWVIILDRYLDSTRVYQGLIGGISLNKIFELEKKYVAGYFPDLTLILYFPENNFEHFYLARKKYYHVSHGQRDKTPFDKENLTIQLNRNMAFLKLPEISKQRKENRILNPIDASLNPIQVIKLSLQSCLNIINNKQLTNQADQIFQQLIKENYFKILENLYNKQMSFPRKRESI